ncbi:MAG TPA: aspartate dehydrogenase, partial [Rhodospirillales bacterium]|nr:aspartate dehydrogenase [Rhodospirillales bacterium]
MTDKKLKVGIVGLGTIGSTLAQHLHDGIDGLSLSSVTVGDPNKNYAILKNLKVIPKVVDLEEISAISDVVVECAPSAVFDKIAVPAIDAGCIFVPA